MEELVRLVVPSNLNRNAIKVFFLGLIDFAIKQVEANFIVKSMQFNATTKNLG